MGVHGASILLAVSAPQFCLIAWLPVEERTAVYESAGTILLRHSVVEERTAVYEDDEDKTKENLDQTRQDLKDNLLIQRS